jgi:hypothetical protein
MSAEPSTAAPNPLQQVFRHLAFEVLPRSVGSKPVEFIANYMVNPERFTARLFREASRGMGFPRDDAVAQQLRSHFGDFGEDCEFYMIEFPRLPGGAKPAISVAAVVLDRETDEVVCYVLSEEVDGSTAVRAVHNRVNWQLGNGPEPLAGAFLKYLRQTHEGFLQAHSEL